jgi:pimeloyl-ACP methyl ester carboxylesterase
MMTNTILKNKHSVESPIWATKGSINYINAAGLSMRYLKIGQGEPLILIHTLRTQLDYFNKIIPELAKHHTVYALDLPGHGYSDITNQAHKKSLFVHHVTEMIKALNLNNVTLVGESVGGSISLAIAAQAKLSVKRVVALNPADYVNSNGIDRSSLLGKILFKGIQLPIVGWIIANAENRYVLRQVLRGGFQNNHNLPAALVKEFNQVGDKKGYTKAFRSIFLNWNSWVEGQQQYVQIKVPVALVYSDQDWSTVAERQYNKELIQGSTLITIKDCGHFSSLDRPEQVINIILQSEA